jgi:hypothetical protein
MPRVLAAKAKHQCIEYIALAGAIGANDAGEVEEGANIFVVCIKQSIPKDLKFWMVRQSSFSISEASWYCSGI